MRTRLFLRVTASAFLSAIACVPGQPAHAQEKYPSRPIEFIVPWGAGGGSDQTARAVAKLLENELGTSVPVINSPGGTGTAGITKLISGQTDGYSIGLLAWDTLALL